MKQKYYVELNRQEWRLIIEGLNRFRNKLIAAGRYTDAVGLKILFVYSSDFSAPTTADKKAGSFHPLNKNNRIPAQERRLSECGGFILSPFEDPTQLFKESQNVVIVEPAIYTVRVFQAHCDSGT